jgi:hypothetical protein
MRGLAWVGVESLCRRRVLTFIFGLSRDLAFEDGRDKGAKMTSTKICTTIAVLAAVLTLTSFSLSAAPASATIGSLTAKLTVAKHPPGTPPNPDAEGLRCQVWLLQQVSYPCWVQVEGSLSTGSRLEAERLQASGHRILMRLWGDDPVSDDLLQRPYLFGFDVKPCCAATWTTFKWARWVNSRVLDEDHYPDRDEIYAGIRLVDSSGRTIRSVESNRVKLNMGLPGAPGPLP